MAAPTQQPTNPSELQLYRVLQRANLLQYYDTFISQGGDDVQQLCEAGEDEFLEIMALVGMASKPLHVRRLQKALQAWVVNPASFEGNVRKAFPTHVHSMTGSTSQSLSHSSQNISSPTHSAVTDRPVSSVQPQQTPQQQQQQQQQDYKVTPPQSSTISTSTPWSSAPTVSQGRGSPSEHSSREQPSPTDSQEEEFKDILFPTEPGQSYSGGMLTHSSFGQPVLLEHQITAIATAAALLAQELPSVEPKSLPKKQISKEINMVMSMSHDDPMKMDAMRKYAAIYGRFDSKRKNDRPMSLHEISVNEAAAQLCSHLPALLTRREELFPLARQVVRDSGYQYSKGHSRAAEIVPTKTEPPGDVSPDTALTSSSPSSNGVSVPVPAVSPIEDKLITTQNDLTDVTSNLSELAKEQERIRSALRVLLEAKDHTQMSALTAEMDTINDRYARLTTRRQELVGQLASLRRLSPKPTLPGGEEFKTASASVNNGGIPGIMKPNDKHNKHLGSGNVSNNNDSNYSNSNGNNIGFTPSSNSLNALYMAAALHNSNEGSLIEEGLRIATQYGMSDFAQELIGMKTLQQTPTPTDNEEINKSKNVDIKPECGIVGDKTLIKLKGERSILTSGNGTGLNLVVSSHDLSSANSSPGLRSSSSSPLSNTPLSRPHHPNTATAGAAVPTVVSPATINIVSGVGFQQYVSSATTTTQKLQSLDTIKTSKMSTGVTATLNPKDVTHAKKRSPSRNTLTSSPEMNKLDDYITLSIPKTPNIRTAVNDNQNNATVANISIADNNVLPENSPLCANNSNNNNINNINTSPSSKTGEVEMTRRSCRKRNTDQPDYYLINGGEKRFRSNSARRSSSTSSERNAKIGSGTSPTATAFTNATAAPTSSPRSTSSSPSSSFSSSLNSSGKPAARQSPSPSKGNIVMSVLDDPSGHTVNKVNVDDSDVEQAGRRKETPYGDNVEISDEDSGSGSRYGNVGVEDWVANGDAVASGSGSGSGSCSSVVVAVKEEEESVSVVSLDESSEEGGERRMGRRKRNQPVVSYTAFR